MDFQQHYKGKFINILRWNQLDDLWEKVKAQPNGWYIYLVGETLPTAPVEADKLKQFIEEIDKLLHKEHEHNYCGIVYTDDKETPAMIKIFDPHNLGSSCGSCGTVVHPGWLLTRIPPEVINNDAPTPRNRKRWWQRLFGL